jgi:hypothetical protein
MDDGNDFLVTLPSNSNMKSHPENEPANYTVKLASPIALHGDWEVALVSVQYSHNWSAPSNTRVIKLRFILDENMHTEKMIHSDFDVPYVSRHLRDAARVFARHDNNYSGVDKNRIATKEITFYPYLYSSPQELGDAISQAFNICFPTSKARMTYYYNHIDRTGRLVVSNVDVVVMASDPSVPELLGFTYEVLPCGLCNEREDKKLLSTVEIYDYYSKRQPPIAEPATRHWYLMNRIGNASRNFVAVSSMWIYSDITKRQRVGDAQVPLLGIVPVQKAPNGERTHYCVNPVHFLGVSRSYIDTITIRIATECGDRVPFAKNDGNNNFVCCLRFRRCKGTTAI